MSPNDPRHGTINGYSNKKCRCERCRNAWRVYKSDLKSRNKITGLLPEDERHGRTAGYAYGCRCDSCRTAWDDYLESRKGLKLHPGDARHGTETGYTNWKCRCEQCRTAARRIRTTRGAEKRAQGLPNADDPRHGTVNGYKSYGCRCPACKWALRDDKMRYKYGIGADDFEDLLRGQGGVCASCGDKRDLLEFRLDHDHVTGAVRGVLCHHCNVALGHLRDDVERIERLKSYILNVKEMTV